MPSAEEELYVQDCVIVTLCHVITTLCTEFIEYGCSDPARVIDRALAALDDDLEALGRDTPAIITSDRRTEITVMVYNAIAEGLARPPPTPGLQ